MRGENHKIPWWLYRRLGSPPHARGKSTGHIYYRPRPWDHPRMRGENSTWSAVSTDRVGSPPHARGKFKGGYNRPLISGITPACAGKIGGRGTGRPPPWDHPRMRGENIAGIKATQKALGSPPHARGKFVGRQFLPLPPGITPACAGKILTFWSKEVHARDHPRMRGENSRATSTNLQSRGSPPHARGKWSHAGPGCDLYGITPACAGKIGLLCRRHCRLRDHPRMRGENVI